MKTLCTLGIVILTGLGGFAQTTLALQPDGGGGKDALIYMLSNTGSVSDTNDGDCPSFEAVAWTWTGDPGVIRSLIEFDLSSIPSNAVIMDVRLSLYNDPTSSECGGQSLSLSGPNVAVLQRVTSLWGESTVTWNNQPSTTILHQVTLHQSTNAFKDYLDFDVTAWSTTCTRILHQALVL